MSSETIKKNRDLDRGRWQGSAVIHQWINCFQGRYEEHGSDLWDLRKIQAARIQRFSEASWLVRLAKMTRSGVQWEMLPQNGKWTLTEKDTDVNTLGPHTSTCLCAHTHTLVNMYMHTHTHWRGAHKQDAMRKVLKRKIHIRPLPLRWLLSCFDPDSSQNSMKILALCQSTATSL